jgi:hypothetical protein
MAETLWEEERAAGGLRGEARLEGWKEELREDLNQALEQGGGRWSRAIMSIAWIHLASFLLCQALYEPTSLRDPRLVYIWIGELAVVLAAVRAIAGPGWMRSSPAVGMVARFWGTFLILSFNLVMLNELLGWEMRWYKPAWGTLSTFYFASLAWLFSPRLFIPAVQMYFTALLMVRFRDADNLIYGVAWWLALMGIAYRVRQREGTTVGEGRLRPM